jgi:FkbM family methyltransferase
MIGAASAGANNTLGEHMGIPAAARVAEFTYTVLLRPAPLRRVANATIRALLPKSVKCGPATVVINRNDPVVSGALALSVYEPLERAFVQERCVPGTLFVDVGANVGLYTALAAHAVGANGRVLALEPDPESLGYLKQTIARNHPERVVLHEVAATAIAGPRTLFASSSNRGDNRLTPHKAASEEIEVGGEPLDGLLASEELDGRHLFIKIDVQGGEGGVIDGARASLLRAGSLTLLMEFWPAGLRAAGTNPVALLTSLEALGLVIHELLDGAKLQRVRNFDAFAARYEGRRYTNIVGLRPSS